MIPEEIFEISDDEIKIKLVKAFIKDKQFCYHIYLKSANFNIGSCGIKLLNDENNDYYGNIEYRIKPNYQGNNYAYRASKLLALVASYFGKYNLTITASTDNIPSIKVIEKLGGVFIGIREVPKNMRLFKDTPKVVAYEWNIKEEGKIK